MMVMSNTNSEMQQYYELSYYTLAHPGPQFIHQHIVDAFAAQTANHDTKSIAVAFALIGLSLYLEKNCTGKQVQLAHMALTNRKKDWPRFDLPKDRGEITVADVLSKPEGEERDAMIHAWCASVWQAYRDTHTEIRSLIANFLSHSSTTA